MFRCGSWLSRRLCIESPAEESRGDLADQAELQIEADLLEEIEKAKRPKGSVSKKS
jgi:hypothetical protein